jgi:hypothetical protein
MTVFSYRSSKGGEVFISSGGRVVTTLRGARAAVFLSRADGADEAGRQALMQRATGNFKRGNER